MKSKKFRIASLFKPFIVKRPKGNCQVLFALTELDGLIDKIENEVTKLPEGCEWCEECEGEGYHKIW